MSGGPGRRPGATVVPVSLRLLLRSREGTYVFASSPWTVTEVAGDELEFRLLIANRSLYDVGQVIVEADFSPAVALSSPWEIMAVEGANYGLYTREFFIDRIQSGEEITVSFRLVLPEPVTEELSQLLVRLLDFTVLEASRRYPLRTPGTPPGKRTQTVARVGIGSTDVACFTGYLPPQRIGGGIAGARGSALVPMRPSVVQEQTAGSVSISKTKSIPEVTPDMLPRTGVPLSSIFLILQVLLGLLLASLFAFLMLRILLQCVDSLQHYSRQEPVRR
jgi:hypothetical protein